VEVRVYDMTSRDRLDLGVEWAAGRNTTIGNNIGDNPTAGHTKPFTEGVFFADTGKTADAFDGGVRLGWFADDVDIDLVIRMQKEDIEAKLLANPRILVLDNEAALFDIVTEYPYAERQISAAGITETIKWRNIGVKLGVTPHVTRDGMLRLHIMPEFGILIETVSFASGDVPVIDTRKVDTIALVKEGHTVVLGGLRKKGVSKQVNKIPLFGDLPLIGALFRFEGEDTQINELMIFITPRIVEEPRIMTRSEVEAYKLTDFGGPDMTMTRAEEEVEQMEAVE
jgi:type IV pilus assembly protein PilQ